MYLGFIVLMMLVLPLLSVAAQASMLPEVGGFVALLGKWFTFWAVGVRLFVAGLNQVFRPDFTAEEIFETSDQGARAIVREVGFGNLAIGTLGILSLVVPAWVVSAAVAGGLYYGLAGLAHLARKNRTFKESVALVSDLAVFVLLAVFVASRYW